MLCQSDRRARMGLAHFPLGLSLFLYERVSSRGIEVVTTIFYAAPHQPGTKKVPRGGAVSNYPPRCLSQISQACNPRFTTTTTTTTATNKLNHNTPNYIIFISHHPPLPSYSLSSSSSQVEIRKYTHLLHP
ncbi:hypothetical protein K440DRAFT_37521 [Wilcoxina mikolae CBS 423.85]|nr:hypothetical protein K440DRAFT_37521 [Wilcoxina mikolae CBS 423.85]